MLLFIAASGTYIRDHKRESLEKDGRKMGEKYERKMGVNERGSLVSPENQFLP